MARVSAHNGRYPALPTGTEVASFKTYEEAVGAVETLSAADFPLPAVSIVGSDLHIAETVMGKLTPGRVAFAGAGQGLTWGLLMGLMSLVLLPEYSPLAPIMAILAGVAVGVVFAIVSWAGGKGRRSFAAQSQLVASRYAVLVSEQTDHAFKLLQGARGNLQQRPKTRTRKVNAGPTEFGSLPDEAPKFGVRLTPAERRVNAVEPAPKVFAPSAPSDRGDGESSTVAETGDKAE